MTLVYLYHIPSADNDADCTSRKFNDQIEWQLNPVLFGKIAEVFENPNLDLFASRLNKQLPLYVSWKPDPGAQYIDAFSFNWSSIYMYAFPPFSLIGRVLQKIRADQASRGVDGVPPMDHAAMVYGNNGVAGGKPNDSATVSTNTTYSSSGQLSPITQKISSRDMSFVRKAVWKTDQFRSGLPTSLWNLGEKELKNNMQLIFKNGFRSVMLINFFLLTELFRVWYRL